LLCKKLPHRSQNPLPFAPAAGAIDLGYVSAIDSNGRTIWIADAHRDGKRFIVHADEKLTALLELERVTLEARK
jgi:hypothetical protein